MSGETTNQSVGIFLAWAGISSIVVSIHMVSNNETAMEAMKILSPVTRPLSYLFTYIIKPVWIGFSLLVKFLVFDVIAGTAFVVQITASLATMAFVCFCMIIPFFIFIKLIKFLWIF